MTPAARAMTRTQPRAEGSRARRPVRLRRTRRRGAGGAGEPREPGALQEEPGAPEPQCRTAVSGDRVPRQLERPRGSGCAREDTKPEACPQRSLQDLVIRTWELKASVTPGHSQVAEGDIERAETERSQNPRWG